MKRCRHSKMWIVCGCHLAWCYECGAIRQLQPSEMSNGCYTIGGWVRPVGAGGKNPWPGRFNGPSKTGRGEA